MRTSDLKKIKTLIDDGYKVVIRDLKGKHFNNRFDVFQEVGFSDLKKVIVDSDGEIIALAG